MLQANITIQNVAYENSAATLQPVLLELVGTMEDDNPIAYLFNRLGSYSGPFMVHILRRMSYENKHELLCMLVNKYEADVRACFNNLLAANEFGRYATIGGVKLFHQDGYLRLTLSNIDIDYTHLLRTERMHQFIDNTVQKHPLGKAASRLVGSPDPLSSIISMGLDTLASRSTRISGAIHKTIEKHGMKYLQNQELQEKLIHEAHRILLEKGICATIAGIAITNDEPQQTPIENANPPACNIQSALLDALAAYLIDTAALDH